MKLKIFSFVCLLIFSSSFVSAALVGSGNTTLSVTVSDGSSPPVDPNPGGGGGGGGSPSAPTGVTFSGRAYPLSRVSILKDGQLAVTTIAGPDARFSVALTTLAAGSYTFSVYGEDKDGRRSSTFTFPVYVTNGATTNVSGIFIAPTISVDKSQVKRGDNLAIFGQSTPSSAITIEVNSETQIFLRTNTDANGVYLYQFDTAPLEIGQHLTRSKAALATELSEFGAPAIFAVGTKNILAKNEPQCPAKGDLNSDCKVNLVDFSIAAFWYKRSLTGAFKLLEKANLSGEGSVDLRDFSIMAYYWTG